MVFKVQFYLVNQFKKRFQSKDVQLKKEFDWKKAYLCRKEGKDEAEICWTVDLTGLKAKRAFLKVDGMATFEGSN